MLEIRRLIKIYIIMKFRKSKLLIQKIILSYRRLSSKEQKCTLKSTAPAIVRKTLPSFPVPTLLLSLITNNEPTSFLIS